jgi:nicotinate-nucleotide adenylyltransferase
VIFVPARRQPLKDAESLAPAEDRLEMLRLALAENPAFEISAIELAREGPSYTVDTLVELARRETEAELFLILGTDAFQQAGRWRRFDEVRRLAHLVIVARPAAPGSTSALDPASAVTSVQVPALEISGSDIRARVAQGRSIRYLVPEPVRAYIAERGLYRS